MGFLLFQRKKFHLGVSDKPDNRSVFLDFVALGFVGDVSSPDSLECSKTSWSVNIGDNTGTNHWRSLDNGNWFDDFFFVHLSTRSLNVTKNVRHTSLVSDETGKMRSVFFVVLGMGF